MIVLKGLRESSKLTEKEMMRDHTFQMSKTKLKLTIYDVQFTVYVRRHLSGKKILILERKE